MALASATDLQDYLQQTVDANTSALILDMATGVIQAYTRQQLEYVQNDTVDLTPMEGRLVLPERPVVDVTAVAGLSTGDWTLVRDTIYPGPVYIHDWELDDILTSNVTWTPLWKPTVQVTYSHGFQSIPNDLKALCLSVAARLYANPTSIESEMIGQTSTRYSQKGGLALTDVEKQLANRYKSTVRTMRITPAVQQLP